MRLYVGVYSGYSQKVRIALAEKGELDAIEQVVVPGEEKQGRAHRARSPLGLVPVLELDDGTMLPESTPIIEYLDALYPEPALFPADPLLRARAHALDHYNDQALTPAVRRYWHAWRHQPAATRDAVALAAARADIDAVFLHLETQLSDSPYLVGVFSIADIAFMQRLQLLPMLDVPLPADCPRVRGWEQRLRARPSWDRTMYPPLPEATD